MFKRLVLSLTILFTVSGTLLAPMTAVAELRLPNYAQSADAETAVESLGQRITNLVSLVVAIICIIGMLIGAGYAGAGNGERARQFFVGSMIGLAIAGTAYGIAAVFT